MLIFTFNVVNKIKQNQDKFTETYSRTIYDVHDIKEVSNRNTEALLKRYPIIISLQRDVENIKDKLGMNQQ